MFHLPDSVAAQKTAYNTAASGSDSVITLAAPSGDYPGRHVLDWVTWSYAAAPTSGSLSISGIDDGAGGTLTLNTDITAGGPGQLVFGDRGLKGAANTAVVVTLVNGAQTKKLWVQYR